MCSEAACYRGLVLIVPVFVHTQLRKTIEKILSQPGAVRPEKTKFFRGQMQTIISKALQECNVKPVPSRRCFTIICRSHCRGFLHVFCSL